MNIEEEVGSKLKVARQNKKYSLRTASEMVGISFSYLSQIENGKLESLPNNKILENLCELYGIEFSSLFGKEVELPSGWQELGVEWIRFADEMKKENLTPEEIKEYLDLVKKLKNL